jgi:hypothetical protein
MRIQIAPFIICFMLITALNAQSTDIKEFDWLSGSWEMKTTTGILLEVWTIESDSSMQGRSFKVKTSGDTVVLESIQLVCHNGACAYVPIARGQNNGMPVRFAIEETGQFSFMASNPSHDFPQKIKYRREGSALYASVSADKKEIKYSFTRIPDKP